MIVANSSNKIIGLFISGFIFSMLSIIVLQTPWDISSDISEGPSTVELIGHLILGKYLLPFELVSVLLLAALTGSAMLARKKIDEPLSTSDDLEKNIEKEENLDNDSEKEKLDDKGQEKNTNG